MDERRQLGRGYENERQAAVWIDHDQAVIRKQGVVDDHDVIERLERSPAESEPAFDLRTIHEIIDRDRVVVSGPAVARLGFERAYVAMTHRPNRLLGVDHADPPRAISVDSSDPLL